MSIREAEKDAEFLEMVEIVESWCRRAREGFVAYDAESKEKVMFMFAILGPLKRSLIELLETSALQMLGTERTADATSSHAEATTALAKPKSKSPKSTKAANK